MKRRLLFLLPLLMLTMACGDDIDLTGQSPTAPSGPNPVKVEIRVFGSQIQNIPVTIRHTNSLDGMTNISGLVPYIFSFDSRDESIFLYVEAGGSSFSQFATLQVQIFVDGKLFKEGASQGFTLYSQASGTYRR
jgi:hypothetical protein